MYLLNGRSFFFNHYNYQYMEMAGLLIIKLTNTSIFSYF